METPAGEVRAVDLGTTWLDGEAVTAPGSVIATLGVRLPHGAAVGGRAKGAGNALSVLRPEGDRDDSFTRADGAADSP